MRDSPTRDRFLVDEMLTHADLVAENVKRGRDSFEIDLTVRYAVEHAVELFAEAAEKTSQALKGVNPQIPWERLRELRHDVVHPYDVGAAPQSVERLWKFARDDLPGIVRRLKKSKFPAS